MISWWRWDGGTAACGSRDDNAATLTAVSGGAKAHRLVALLFHRQHHGLRVSRPNHAVTDVLLDRHEHVNLAEFQGENALAKHNTSLGAPNLAEERK